MATMVDRKADERQTAFHLRVEADSAMDAIRRLESLVVGFAAHPAHADDPHVQHLAEYAGRYCEELRDAAKKIIALSWNV